MSASTSSAPNAQRERLRQKFSKAPGADEHPNAPGADEPPPNGEKATEQPKPRIINQEAALDALFEMAKLPAIPTPFQRLNDALGGGLLAGQTYVVAAGTGSGKTAFALAVAAYCAKTGPALFASLELPAPLLVARMAPGAWLDAIRGKVPRETIAKALPPGLAYLNRPTVPEIERAVECISDGLGVAPLVVIDYLQLLAEANLGSDSDIRVTTARTSEQIRTLADRTKAPLLVVSAVSRGGNQRLRGARSAAASEFVDVARESSGIEYDAAALLALHVSDDEDDDGRRIATLAVAKNRFGPHAMLDFRFDGAAGSWGEVGEVDSSDEAREELRDQILKSVKAAESPPTKNLIIKRDGKQLVKGRRQVVLKEIEALVAGGELFEVGGKYHLRGGE